MSSHIATDDNPPLGFQVALTALAEFSMWIAPVGAKGTTLGWMVCRRGMNNWDGPNTKVEYLRRERGNGWWKKPFRDSICQFANTADAIEAALNAVERAKARDWRGPEA